MIPFFNFIFIGSETYWYFDYEYFVKILKYRHSVVYDELDRLSDNIETEEKVCPNIKCALEGEY